MSGVRLALWFLGGAGLGLLNTVLLVRSVRLLNPGARAGSMQRVLTGFFLRYVFIVMALVLAVRQGLGPMLALGLGLWLARWMGVVVGHRGGMDWVRLKA
jgi:hypothetical protein